jgi:hypothetical protein
LAPAFESPEAPLPEPQPEPFGLEPDPWASDALPEPLAEPSPPPEFELEPSIPGLPADDEPMEAASELEYQIDSPEFLGGQGEPAGGMEALGSPQTAEGTHPPFFPEEEFGRAHPDVEEPDPFYDAEAPTAIIETSSGKQIRLDAPTHRDAAAASTEGQPSLLRAIGGAIIATFAGALVWVLLAIPAARGASPLALAVAVMVGISVRRQRMAFRIVGMVFTLIGTMLGAIGAAAALHAMESGEKLSGILPVLSSTDTVLAAVINYYGPLDLISVTVAMYVAFRLSATKPES